MNNRHFPTYFFVHSTLLFAICLLVLLSRAFAQSYGQIKQTQFVTSDLESTEKLVTVINSGERVQVQYFLPRSDLGCVISLGSTEGTRQCSRGLLIVRFSGPVSNPIIHLATGTSFVAGNAWAITNSYRLVTPGATVTLPHKSTYLDVITFMGQPQIRAKALRTFADVIQPTCVMAINLDKFCDEVQISGSYSSLTFQVDRIAVPVLTYSSANETLPPPP